METKPEIQPDLTLADLTDVDLKSADLSFADLSWADLRVARLFDTNLSGTKMLWVQMVDASLRGTNLSRSNLSWANLTGAYLHEVKLDQAMMYRTVMNDLDLRDVEGLKSVEHRGPSDIGILTIYKSQGEIPEVFLRDAGVPDSFIEYARSLIGKPIEFYSAFISYSSKDEEFARRLYNDLQMAGVRCWFAPEDLKIGTKIRPTIDESIRLHDKLLLVLSRSSVTSQWVEQEVETALARERKESKTVLFPVRIDQTVMKQDIGWPALLRNTRNIGDFTRWKDHDAYRRAFARLLRDLKADAALPTEPASEQYLKAPTRRKRL